MSAVLLKFRVLDSQLREGYEYIDPFWEIIGKYRRLRTLELEYAYAVAVEQKNEFHRRVKDNDCPGRRHMLPFTWKSAIGIDGVRSMHQIPIRFESIQYQTKMAEFARKVADARSAFHTANMAECKEV